MTEARLYVLRCPECGAWADEQDGARICWGCNAHPEGDYPDLEHVEYLPVDSVSGLVEAADSLAGRVEDIVDTANWQKDPVTVARKLAVPLGKYQAAREALASFPTQPEPEQGGSE